MSTCLPIIFEDQDLLIVNKPAGIYSHKNHPDHQVENLVDILSDKMNFVNQEIQATPDLRQGLVHRLDRDTSGLVILAKNPKALSLLQGRFKKRQIVKKYQALVHGHCFEPDKLLVNYLARNERKRTQVKVVEDPSHTPENDFHRPVSKITKARKAETLINPIAYYQNVTLLEIEIFTGRTHQIRVQLAQIGHPVVGDKIYGYKKLSTSKNANCLPSLDHLFLCAYQLEFVHPITEEWLSLEIPLPDFFQEALAVQKSFSLTPNNH